MSTTAAPLVNGFRPSANGNVNEALEYEKILKLRDEIFAGSHPRLTLHPHAARKVSPRLSQLSSQSQTVVQPSPTQLPGLNITSVQEEDQNKHKTSSSATSFQFGNTSSGIDPVLLTKSADLIKAEIQLQRQRLEKQLREQFEQKRLDFRKKPSPPEAKPDFDVSSLLAKALEVAKPDLSEGKGVDSDSFDENSFYSSRAPDSIVGEEEHSPSSQEQSLQDSFGVNGPSEVLTPFAQNITPAGPPYRPPSRSGLNVSNSSRPMQSLDSAHKPPYVTDSTLEVDDEDEEGEYSPPEAMDHYPTPNVYGSQAIPDIRNRPMRRYSDLDENGKRPMSPSEANMRIVRNQIISPIAPQPSRVSPLALTKEPFALQDRRLRNGRQRGRAGSPSESPEPVGHTRKKRKLERKAEKKARKIKQEAVSPPPFHEIQPLGSGKPSQQDSRPILIDDSPAQEIRYIRAPEGYIETPQRPMSRHAAPMMPLSEPRPSSRTTMRPVRDDQDLRRVASLHGMRAERPRDHVEYATPTRTRAASYLRVGSPMREAPSSFVPEYDREPQELRVMRTPVPEYREVYEDAEPEVRYIPEPMPPPPRERIVVDQYGRRFREIIQDRSSVAPRTVSATYPDRDQGQYYEGYERRRAGSVMLDERPPQRHEQEMPPPRMVRQVADSPRTATTAISTRREGYDPISAGRASSVQVLERSGRQMLYADDPGDFRPPVRMSSVRPAPSQYEERAPMQVLSRSGSVRPGGEGSMYVDDGPPMRREYVPAEQPRYRLVEPERRYVDAQGREVVPIHDGGQEGGVRYVQRY